MKLEIAQALPSDCGAYKLVISNPNGENAALCAVAVKRMFIPKIYILTMKFTQFHDIYLESSNSGTNGTSIHQTTQRLESGGWPTAQLGSANFSFPIARG